MQDIRNMVIFGPAESGKSTLSGYLYYSTNKATFDLRRFCENVQKDLVSEYDSSKKFAYIIDRTREERVRIRAKRSGSTKSLHVTKIKFKIKSNDVENDMNVAKIKLDDVENEIYVLDTPGTGHITNTKARENIKGISFADYGIFMIDTKTIKKMQKKLLQYTNLEYLIETLTPLNIWVKHKDKRKLILAISKMDHALFSEEEFENAIEFVESIADINFQVVLPVSIDVNNEIDHNVINKSDKLSWYKGPTLLEVLNDINSSNKTIQTDNKPVIVSLYKEHVIKGIGKAWRGKILQGTLNKSSEIKISPIKDSNSELVDAHAKIAGIYSVDRRIMESAKPGDIVSICIKDPVVFGSRVNKNELLYVKSTCLFDASINTKKGNILQFEIEEYQLNNLSATEETRLTNLSIGGQLILMWFGKAVPCKVLYKKIILDNDIKKSASLTLIVMHDIIISLPLEENGEFLFENFWLELDKNTYLEAILNGVGTSNNSIVSVKAVSEDDIRRISIYFKEFNFLKEGNKLIFKENNVVRLLEHINDILEDHLECMTPIIKVKFFN